VSGEAFMFGWIVVGLLHRRRVPEFVQQPGRSEMIRISTSHQG